MHLWTDYEGVTIDGAFPLRKLLIPEGRSAFFSTSGPSGEPTVVRLIECHFDEVEILARWSSVEALSHPNFLKFERFGQTQLDGRPVVYAVFEKVDGNLAEVLEQGHLTLKDVAQLASSLVAALDVLHTHGFIHEHIEPRNIFAISGIVKLRGDCIREAPEGEDGLAAKRRDVHDLARVLLQGLTQRTSVEGIHDSAMPLPFGHIIRNGLDGSWGLEEIRTALEHHFYASQPTATTSVNLARATTTIAEPRPPGVGPRSSVPSEARLPLPLGNRALHTEFSGVTARKDTRGGKNAWRKSRSIPLDSGWLGAGMVALLLLLSVWVITHAWGAHRHRAEHAVSQPAVVPKKQILTNLAPKPIAANQGRASLPASAGSRADWRVIAFTYNHRTDAEKKVSDLARSNPELTPIVFTPSGHAPYMVAIGGLLNRETAYALARRSRSLGLPHDMYAQNYGH